MTVTTLSAGELEPIREAFRRDGRRFAEREVPMTAGQRLYAALLCHWLGDPAAARDWARAAARIAPRDPLVRLAARHLMEVANGHVSGPYTLREQFLDFATGGGNARLYSVLSDRLSEVYSAYDACRLLDIGVGEGLALLPALSGSVARLDLVEPEPELLRRAVARARGRSGLRVSAFQGTIQDFMREANGIDPVPTWEVVQATFSLHTVPQPDRRDVLRWIRRRTARLLVVEFDHRSKYDTLHPRRVIDVAERYRKGVLEYGDREDPTPAQRFLATMFFSCFSPDSRKWTHEQPIADWIADLKRAGFQTVSARLLDEYWWADGYLLDAA